MANAKIILGSTAGGEMHVGVSTGPASGQPNKIILYADSADNKLHYVQPDGTNKPIGAVPDGGVTGDILIKNSPVNGDVSWKENIAKVKIMDGPTGPLNPTVGDVWFDSNELNSYVYYSDGVTSLWVPITSPVVEGTVPTGGATGMVLAKQSGADYDLKWTTPSSGFGVTGATGFGVTGATGAQGNTGATGLGIIPGGASGQVLGKTGPGDYEFGWITSSGSGVPTGGVTGYALVKNSIVDGDATWSVPIGKIYVQNTVPAGATVGSLWYYTSNLATYAYVADNVNPNPFWIPLGSSPSVAGATGATGPKGDAGATGATGLQGATGPGGTAYIANTTDTYTSTPVPLYMVSLTSAEYTGLATKDPNTVYIII